MLPWVGRTREHGANRDGEADLVIAHPDRGILVLEVKAGDIARDGQGRWWAGGRQLPISPQEQAADSKHALVAKLRDLPGWPMDLDPIAGHAVAFPDIDLDSARDRLRLLGPDLPAELVVDANALATPDAARTAIERIFAYWAADQVRRRPPGEQGIELLDTLLSTPLELRSLLRTEIGRGEAEVVELTKAQLHLLTTLRGRRRVAISGWRRDGQDDARR